jgi:hypothetical protein
MSAAILLAASLLVPAATPTPTPSESAPSAVELIRREVAAHEVKEGARDKRFLIGIVVTDTKEKLTVELADMRVDVREGLPVRAEAVLFCRRKTLEELADERETLSGALKNGLVDVQGNIEPVLEILDCCVRRAPAR